MISTNEILEQILVDSIELKNEHQFRYIIGNLNINPDEPQESLNGLSIFEKVLETPNTRRFIELCLQNGSEFYASNKDGVHPFHYAINSLSTENLHSILQASTCDDNISKNNFSMIVNRKLDDGGNYLHFLIERLTEENYDEVSEMIKVLLKNNCSPNSPNDQLETPFCALLIKLRALSIDSDLVEFFIKYEYIDVQSFRRDEVLKLMAELGLSSGLLYQEPIKDVNFMLRLLEQWNERKFVDEFEEFNANQSKSSLQYNYGILLETATSRNMQKAATLLLNNGADVNEISRETKFLLPPPFIACCFGHHEVLSVFLRDSTLKFECYQSNLLHQVCYSSKVHAGDRQKCFDMLTADRRCSQEIVNGLDDAKFVPLYYACQNGFNEIAIDLLRRGAFIGHESVVDNLSKDVLSKFLDECIKSSKDILDKNCEIHIDFRCLVPTNTCDQSEIPSVSAIAQHPKLTELVLHPVITSFLHLKWKKVEWPVYFNLLAYFSFLMFLGFFLTEHFKNSPHENFEEHRIVVVTDEHIAVNNYDHNFQSEYDDDDYEDYDHPTKFKITKPSGILGRIYTSVPQTKVADKPEIVKLLLWGEPDLDHEWSRKFAEYFDKHSISYRICVLGVLLMAIYELIECVTSFRKYLFKLSNWLDVGLICLAYVSLFHSFDIDAKEFKKIRALTILVMAAQSIQVIAKLPILSLHMAIFKRVCVTFLKTISLYMVLILAFAMSFYTMDESDEQKLNDAKKDGKLTYSDPFASLILTMRMMLTEFESFKFTKDEPFKGALFLIFVVLITIVLFNLLNALAISDTHNILKVAELVDTKKRISILMSYEKVFLNLSLTLPKIFPEVSAITVTPNKSKVVKIRDVCSGYRESTPPKVKGLQKFLNTLHAKLIFWKRGEPTLTLGENPIEKIVKFVEAQQQNIL